MSTLALEGLAPPQSLRLDGSVWGIDCSVHRIAIVGIQPRGDEIPEFGAFSHDVNGLKGARRLARLEDELRPVFAKIAGVAPPVGVLVEQPFGQGKARPHPQSYYIVGAVLASLGHELPDGVLIDVVEPSSWKKAAMGEGFGFAKKARILGWAKENGYTGDCDKCHGLGDECDAKVRAHDEADAFGVATCAGVRWQASRRLR